MKSPTIKPSHKGLLHEDLGVPTGQKIGHARLEAAKHSSDPAIRKRANFALNFNDHGSHGYVTHVSAHHSRGAYATVTIAHGKRSRRKNSAGEMATSDYDDRPTSTITMPKAHAARFKIGQHVGIGAVPLSGPGTDEMDDGFGDDGDGDDQHAQDAYDDMRRSIRTGNPIKREP